MRKHVVLTCVNRFSRCGQIRAAWVGELTLGLFDGEGTE